jgi:hypothetical protein
LRKSGFGSISSANVARGGDARLEPGDVMRHRDRHRVFVKRAMNDVVGHGISLRPVREMAECAK